MVKAALVGAIALATIGSSMVKAEEAAQVIPVRSESSQGQVVTEAHMARLKAALKLTPEQERHWPAVEAAFHALARQQQQSTDQTGSIMQHMRNRGAAINVTTGSFQRIAYAAMPLLRSLDDTQKQKAAAFARSIGMGAYAAAF